MVLVVIVVVVVVVVVVVTKAKNQPLDRSLGFQEVEAPRISRQLAW